MNDEDLWEEHRLEFWSIWSIWSNMVSWEGIVGSWEGVLYDCWCHVQDLASGSTRFC